MFIPDVKKALENHILNLQLLLGVVKERPLQRNDFDFIVNSQESLLFKDLIEHLIETFILQLSHNEQIDWIMWNFKSQDALTEIINNYNDNVNELSERLKIFDDNLDVHDFTNGCVENIFNNILRNVHECIKSLDANLLKKYLLSITNYKLKKEIILSEIKKQEEREFNGCARHLYDEMSDEEKKIFLDEINEFDEEKREKIKKMFGLD